MKTQIESYTELLQKNISQLNGFDIDIYAGSVFKPLDDSENANFLYCTPGYECNFDVLTDYNIKIPLAVANTEGDCVYSAEIDYYVTFDLLTDIHNFVSLIDLHIKENKLTLISKVL